MELTVLPPAAGLHRSLRMFIALEHHNLHS